MKVITCFRSLFSRLFFGPSFRLFAVFAVLLLLPVVSFPTFPSMDGMSHLDNARLMVQLLRGSSPLAAAFLEFNVNPVANWPSHLILAFFTGLLGPEWAEKVLVGFCLLSVPLAARYAIAAVSSEATFYSLLFFPFLLNSLLYRGFYNFIISVFVFLLLIGFWLRSRSHPSLWRLSLLVLVWLFLAVSHVVSFFIALAAVLAIECFPPAQTSSFKTARLRQSVVVILTAFPAIGLVAYWLSCQMSSVHLPAILPRLEGLVTMDVLWSFSLAERLKGMAIFPFCLLIAGAVVFRREGRAPSYRAFRALFLFLLMLYFITPQEIAGGYFMQERLLLYVVFVLFIWSANSNILLRFRHGIILFLFAAVAFDSVHYYAFHKQANKLYAEASSGNSYIREGASLLPLTFASRGVTETGKPLSNKIPLFLHFGAQAALERAGFNLLNYEPATEHFPLRYQPERSPLSLIVRDPFGNQNGSPDVEFGKFNLNNHPVDYVLIWGKPALTSPTLSTRRIQSQLESYYEPVFESKPNGLLTIYRQKDRVSETVSGRENHFIFSETL